MPHVQLVARMNVVRVADVYDYRHPRVRLSQRHRLRLAQLSPLAFTWLRLWRLPIRELHEIERKVAFTPSLAPITNHRRKECAILISAPCIALALIPDGAADRIWCERREHSVVKHTRTVLIIGTGRLWSILTKLSRWVWTLVRF